jgi:3-deoxy-7-phosphoheptulonate synthase
VHPHPELALCDGPQALVDDDLRALAAAVRQLPPLLGRRPAAAATSTSAAPART